METKIKIIVDNKENDGIRGEWGLSVLVDHNGEKILLDVGASVQKIAGWMDAGNIIDGVKVTFPDKKYTVL